MNKIKIKQSIVINRPGKEIFTYMSALENLVDWSSATIAVKKISQEMMHVGATAQSTIRFLGRWFDITLEVVECEPYHFLTIKSISGVAPCLFCYQFETVEDNRTNVSQEAMIQLTEGVLEHTTPVIDNAVRRQLEYDLLTLKDILESKASSYRSAD
ncbi:MAG: SRPBCC family protein [Ktedonobacteraceae bacterium]